MSIWKKITGIIGGALQIGIAGPKISISGDDTIIIKDKDGSDGILNVSQVTGLTAYSGSTDAVPKSYCVAIGLPKKSVRALATSNITLANLQTIDGVSLLADERVGVIGQTDASENGIYDVKDSAPWVRSTDCDGTPDGEVTSGICFSVREGTLYSGWGCILITPDPIVIDTTDLEFTDWEPSAASVLKGTFDANTIIKADSDDTPIALTVPEQTLVGRITSGVITALTASEVKTMLGLDFIPDLTNSFWVDSSRTDSYTEDGSIGKPYKTISSLMTAIGPPVDRDDARRKICVYINSGQYDEDVTIPKQRLITFYTIGVVIIGDGVGDDYDSTTPRDIIVENTATGEPANSPSRPMFAIKGVSTETSSTHSAYGAGNMIISGDLVFNHLDGNTTSHETYLCGVKVQGDVVCNANELGSVHNMIIEKCFFDNTFNLGNANINICRSTEFDGLITATGFGRFDSCEIDGGITGAMINYYPPNGFYHCDVSAGTWTITNALVDYITRQQLIDNAITVTGGYVLLNKIYIGDVENGVSELTFNANTILKADSDDTPIALTVTEQTLIGRITSGVITALTASEVRTLINVEDGADVTDSTNVDSAGAVMGNDYDANTILKADSDNTPTTLTVTEQTLVGRITSGVITALSATEVRTLLNVEDGADVTDSTNVNSAGAVMEADFDANTILKADTDNTPSALTVAEQTIVGRITSGVITALTASEVRTLLNINEKNTDTQLDSGSIEVDADDCLEITKTAYFTAEVDNGNSGAADTISWKVGNKQKSTLTADCTFTFTAPSGACSLTLRLIQDTTAGWDVTWPAAVTWLGDEATWTDGTSSKSIIVSFYYDGTTYWGMSSPWEV